MRFKILFLILFAFSRFQSNADTLVLSTGQVISGHIKEQNEKGVKFQRGANTYTYGVPSLVHILRAGPLASAGSAIPNMGQILEPLGRFSWANNPKQIPATVIDQGVLKNVPYTSFRCGSDYEINVYGDLDTPACVEIGCYRNLLKSSEAKENCIAYMMELFPPGKIRDALRNVSRQKAELVVDGMTLEVTPPEAPDAYGGWWVSIHSTDVLDHSRASATELKEISAVPTATKTVSDPEPWTETDLKYARPSTITVPLPAAPSRVTNYSEPPRSGPVYVRGYYRKDGTYVRPHTRRR